MMTFEAFRRTQLTQRVYGLDATEDSMAEARAMAEAYVCLTHSMSEVSAADHFISQVNEQISEARAARNADGVIAALHRSLATVTQQRDELLAALRVCRSKLPYGNEATELMVDVAIAKVKGGAQ